MNVNSIFVSIQYAGYMLHALALQYIYLHTGA